MRHTHLSSLAGLDDQCLTHHFIRLNGRAPSPEELAGLRGREPASPPDARFPQPDHSKAATRGTPTRAVLREIAQLIHRL
jgi:hypothetical protein